MLEIIFIITFVYALLLGIFIYIKNPRNLTNASLATTCILFSIWIMGNFVIGFTQNPFCARFVYAIGSLLPCSVLIFTLEFCSIEVKIYRKIAYWILSFIFFGLAFTKFFIKKI